jgi:8-oxo-dGTP pyrophosphatase MutT (NUDIX family)
LLLAAITIAKPRALPPIASIFFLHVLNQTSTMAESNFRTQQYISSDFVESCGAIVFDLSKSSKRVCLINIIAENKWVLAKGRREINESRKDAAVREFCEETGFRCELLPVRMSTCATTVDDPPDMPNQAREHAGLTEPFMCTIRELPSGNGVKVIWWFVAVLGEERSLGEATFRPEFFDCEVAVEKLYFETDREVLRRAIGIVENTVSSGL